MSSSSRFVAVLSLVVLATGTVFAQTAEELADQDHVVWYLVPDSPQGGGVVCTPGNVPVTVYSTDFEADDGGWTISGFGDWQWGPPVLGVHDLCDTSPRPEPSGPVSGFNVTANNLDGCYQNSGATSTLSQTFDFTDVLAPISLSLWQWHEVFGTFDTIDVMVNGDMLFEDVSSGATADWESLVLNLDAYAGLAAVTVEFNLNATTVVNRSGWYLDDIIIEGCGVMGPVSEIPTAQPVGLVVLGLMLALLGAFVVARRRRTTA
jgi:hypothetical protein